MAKKNFIQTPIPHKSEGGKPMAYIVSEAEINKSGVSHEIQRRVSRSEFFAIKRKTDGLPYVDDEAGCVFLLPRNDLNETIARENMQYIWREDKHDERELSCAAKGTTRCPISCESCCVYDTCESEHRATNGLLCAKKCEFCDLCASRIVELDVPLNDNGNEEGEARFIEITDSADFVGILEDEALLNTLYKALGALVEKDQNLMRGIYWDEKTVRELATELGFKQSTSISSHKRRILEILRQNEALKSFFE